MTEQWLRVAAFPPGVDLDPLRARLDQRRIPYKLTEEEGEQVLWLAEAARLRETMAILHSLFRVPNATGDAGLTAGLQRQFRQAPVMMICLLLSALGAAVVQWQFQWVPWLTFQDFYMVGPREIGFRTFAEGWARGEYWRLVSPIFLHFGLFHLAFNALWLWEFGRRVEAVAGSLHFLLLVLFTGVVSNYSQYLWSGPSLFGGMSGVLYALLGYLWIRNHFAPHPVLAVPRGILGFMLFWLVLCMSGVVDFFLQGSIANAAHFSGLVIGMGLGAIFGLTARKPV